MGRGGSPKGGHNNILTTTSATPEELSNLAGYALAVFRAPIPDLHNPEEVNAAIINYFENCQQHGLRPGNLGLYAALGLSRQDYNAIINGRVKSKVSPDCIDMMKKAVRAIGVYREGLALEGKINPVTYIFMGKNYDGLEDQTKLAIQADTGPAATLSPEEVAKQIEQDIPIDADYTAEE